MSFVDNLTNSEMLLSNVLCVGLVMLALLSIMVCWGTNKDEYEKCPRGWLSFAFATLFVETCFLGFIGLIFMALQTPLTEDVLRHLGYVESVSVAEVVRPGKILPGKP